jgi:hypothetical protein
MNIVFAIFAMIYAAIGVSTIWMPLVSTVFFAAFALALMKSLTHLDKPVKRSTRLSYKK